MEVERDAFLRAIRDSPPNDATALLVYADWLDDHGERSDAVRLLARWVADPVSAVASLYGVPRHLIVGDTNYASLDLHVHGHSK